jgi:hypothetical protein
MHRPAQPPPVPQPQTAPPPDPRRDPLVAAVMNETIMEVTSTLVAKMERAAFYTEKQKGKVFRTAWARRLFDEVVRRMMAPNAPMFDIDAWHAQQDAKRPGGVDRQLSPSLIIQQAGTIDWVAPLFELEMRIPGFMIALHNVLDLEDETFAKLKLACSDAADASLLDSCGSVRYKGADKALVVRLSRQWREHV